LWLPKMCLCTHSRSKFFPSKYYEPLANK